MTTFGESHGAAIGCVVDGVPAGVAIDESYIQSELDRRRPGQNRFATQRNEPDSVRILSGVFEGVSTGTPIAMVIENTNQKSSDYGDVAKLFRPGHADFTYYQKYGVRDYRGGGRSSARETAARVAAAAIAKLMLLKLGISVGYGVCEIGGIEGGEYDFEHALGSDIFALDKTKEDAWKARIDEARNSHNSVGGVAFVRALGVPAGFGEPMYHKLDAALAGAMMGINGVKGVEIGDGFAASRTDGASNNDRMSSSGFLSNHAGGILGGISTGQPIDVRVAFKPTPSIFLQQSTVDIDGNEAQMSLKGRHDPCIATRGSVVAGAMMALVLADMALLFAGSKMSQLEALFKEL